MQTQDLIEIKKGSIYTFTHFIENQNSYIIPSTAFITIMDSDGDSILTKTAMTINATTGVCTYAWDSTGKEEGLNYQVKFELDSYNPVIRLFDIYLYPFINNITDDDLITEYSGIKDGIYEVSGKAQSGTVNTIIDRNRNELDDHWKGGQLTIFQGQDVYTRKVTGFVLSTNTITFSPNLDNAIMENNYSMRQSFQDKINRAGIEVQLYFKKLEKRASLIMDSYTCKQLILYKFFEHYFFELIKKDDDEFNIKYKYYADKYQAEMEGLKLVYDSQGDGIIDDGEEDRNVGSIEWFR